MRISRTGFVFVTALALAGCGSANYGSETAQPSGPSSLTPAPVGGVEQSQLPPPQNDGGNAGMTDTRDAAGNSGAMTGPGQSEEDAGETQQMASVDTSANAPAVEREALIGRWTVSASGSSCDLFLALTKWTGGYRAASRNCSGIAEDVSAWDVRNNTVVLADSTGNQLATLTKTGGKRFQGTTQTGDPISLAR